MRPVASFVRGWLYRSVISRLPEPLALPAWRHPVIALLWLRAGLAAIATLPGLFDNVFRSALSMLFINVLSRELVPDPEFTNTLSAGLLIIPFFLFSAFAGQLADKYDKAVIARRIKLAEIGIVSLASYSLFSNNVPLQLFCVFLAGVQSSFFGPIKYSILPQYLHKNELLGGNGLIDNNFQFTVGNRVA